MVDTQLLLDFKNSLLLGGSAHIARKAKESTVENGLVDGQGGQHGVFLVDKPNHVLVVGIVDLLTIDVEITANSATLVLASKDVEEGGFTGARGSHDRRDLARPCQTLNAREDLLAVEAVGYVLKEERGRFVISHELETLVVRIIQMDGAILKLPPRKIPDNQDDGNEEERAPSDDASDERSINLGDRTFVARNLGVVQTFPRTAGQEDALVTKHVADEFIHVRLFEGAIINPPGLLVTFEGSRAFDLLVEEVGKINRSILSTEHAIRYATALDLLALIARLVGVFIERGAGLALIKMAIE